MNSTTIARAWKDKTFRSQLSAEQRAALPANPAGHASLNSKELQESPCITSPICTLYGPRCQF